MKAVISGSRGGKGNGADVIFVTDECGARREDGLVSGHESPARMRFLRELAISVVSKSERVTYELVA